VVTVTVTGSGVTTLVTKAVVTVAVEVKMLVEAVVDVAKTVTVDVGALEMAQEQKADRSAGG
jgi:hypothetical protein